jgi:hypothetical protein
MVTVRMTPHEGSIGTPGVKGLTRKVFSNVPSACAFR